MLLIFLGFNFKSRLEEKPDPYGLQAKSAIIDRIRKQSGDDNFNAYYYSRLGLDNGFSYLFWYKKTLISDKEAIKKYTIIMPKDYLPQKTDFSDNYIGVLEKQQPGSRQIMFEKM
jgi:hypothetical protein